MSIPEAVVEAQLASSIGPFWWHGEWLTRDGVDIKRCGNWLAAKDEALRLNAEEAARRVIRALADNMPEEAVEAATLKLCVQIPDRCEKPCFICKSKFKQAASIFLNHIAGDPP